MRLAVGCRALKSHAAVLQERFDVLRVAGGRGQRAGALSLCGGGGAAGLAGLGVGQSAVIRDEDGDQESE